MASIMTNNLSWMQSSTIIIPELRTARLCYKLRNQSADIITLAERTA